MPLLSRMPPYAAACVCFTNASERGSNPLRMYAPLPALHSPTHLSSQSECDILTCLERVQVNVLDEGATDVVLRADGTGAGRGGAEKKDTLPPLAPGQKPRAQQ